MKKLLPVLLALLLAACASAPLPRQDFLLSAARQASAVPARYGSLAVRDVQAGKPWRDNAMVYRESAERYVADPYHGYLAAPPQLLSAEVRQWLSQSGLFRHVLTQGSSQNGEWILDSELTGIWIDVTDPKKPFARITARFMLSHDDKIEQDFTLAASAALPDAEPASAAAGLNRALQQLLQQLENRLAGQAAS